MKIMEKEAFQESNGKFNFKRNFLIKFIILAIIDVGLSAAVMLSPSEEETSINEIFWMFFTFIIFAIIIALVLNYVHKWIWECQHQNKKNKIIILVLVITLIGVGVLWHQHQEDVNSCKDECRFLPEQEAWLYGHAYGLSFSISGKTFETQDQCIDYCLSRK